MSHLQFSSRPEHSLSTAAEHLAPSLIYHHSIDHSLIPYKCCLKCLLRQPAEHHICNPLHWGMIGHPLNFLIVRSYLLTLVSHQIYLHSDTPSSSAVNFSDRLNCRYSFSPGLASQVLHLALWSWVDISNLPSHQLHTCAVRLLLSAAHFSEWHHCRCNISLLYPCWDLYWASPWWIIISKGRLHTNKLAIWLVFIFCLRILNNLSQSPPIRSFKFTRSVNNSVTHQPRFCKPTCSPFHPSLSKLTGEQSHPSLSAPISPSLLTSYLNHLSPTTFQTKHVSYQSK